MESVTVTENAVEQKKRGRPATGSAMTAAERQRASRAKRRAVESDSWQGHTLSVMLSPDAYKALRVLAYDSKLTQKEIVEKLLLQAYDEFKRF